MDVHINCVPADTVLPLDLITLIAALDILWDCSYATCKPEHRSQNAVC